MVVTIEMVDAGGVEIRWKLYCHEASRFAYQNASRESTKRLSIAWAKEDGNNEKDEEDR
jgi:hypothetical protein